MRYSIFRLLFVRFSDPECAGPSPRSPLEETSLEECAGHFYADCLYLSFASSTIDIKSEG